MRGRKPKPTHLKLVEGNPGRRPMNRREPKVKGNLGAGDVPDFFNEEQRAAWDYAIANAPAGLLKRLDRSALMIWVVALVEYQKASIAVVSGGQVVKVPSKDPNSKAIMTSPYLWIMNKQAMIMLRAAAELGFTPSSRSRVSVDDGGGEENEDPADRYFQ